MWNINTVLPQNILAIKIEQLKLLWAASANAIQFEVKEGGK